MWLAARQRDIIFVRAYRALFVSTVLLRDITFVEVSAEVKINGSSTWKAEDGVETRLIASSAARPPWARPLTGPPRQSFTGSCPMTPQSTPTFTTGIWCF